MTREEFDLAIEEDTVTQLEAEKVRYTGLISLAKGFQRADIAGVLAKVRAAFIVAQADIAALHNRKESN